MARPAGAGIQLAEESQVRFGSSQAYMKRLAAPSAASPRSRTGPTLRVDPTRQCSFGDAADGQHVGRGSEIDLVLSRHSQRVVEGAGHDSPQSGVDLFERPEKRLAILDPLEV